MLNRIGGAAVAAALMLTAAAPAHAQFGKVSRVLKEVNRVANGGGIVSGAGSDPLNEPAPKAEKLTQLPPEFRTPMPKLDEPGFTVENIKALIRQEVMGIAEIKKIALVREPGPLWTTTRHGDEIEAMEATGLSIYFYYRDTDGDCEVHSKKIVLQKPALPLGGFGPLEADVAYGKRYYGVPCDLS